MACIDQCQRADVVLSQRLQQIGVQFIVHNTFAVQLDEIVLTRSFLELTTA